MKAWRWGRLDVESDDPFELDQKSDLVVSYGYPILVDDRSFSPASNSDYTETTSTELTTSGVKERMHVRGELRKIFRLR